MMKTNENQTGCYARFYMMMKTNEPDHFTVEKTSPRWNCPVFTRKSIKIIHSTKQKSWKSNNDIDLTVSHGLAIEIRDFPRSLQKIEHILHNIEELCSRNHNYASD